MSTQEEIKFKRHIIEQIKNAQLSVKNEASTPQEAVDWCINNPEGKPYIIMKRDESHIIIY